MTLSELHSFAHLLVPHMPGWRYDADRSIESDGTLRNYVYITAEKDATPTGGATIYLSESDGRIHAASETRRHAFGSWHETDYRFKAARCSADRNRGPASIAGDILRKVAPNAMEAHRQLTERVYTYSQALLARRDAARTLNASGVLSRPIDLPPAIGDTPEHIHCYLDGASVEVRYGGSVHFECTLPAEQAVSVLRLIASLQTKAEAAE